MAAERQRQSKDLVAIVTEVKDLKNGLDEVDSGLECVGFNTVEDMEKHIRQLQVCFLSCATAVNSGNQNC